jgi:uncharacterized membrane protein YdjX (TVP38/TMEM64 family)
MLLIELAIGIAVAAVFLVFFVAMLHIIFWVLFGFLVLAALGVLIFSFPLGFLVTILIITLTVMGLFQVLVFIGRAVRKKFYKDPPPPPNQGQLP